MRHFGNHAGLESIQQMCWKDLLGNKDDRRGCQEAHRTGLSLSNLLQKTLLGIIIKITGKEGSKEHLTGMCPTNHREHSKNSPGLHMTSTPHSVPNTTVQEIYSLENGLLELCDVKRQESVLAGTWLPSAPHRRTRAGREVGLKQLTCCRSHAR